MKLRLQRFFILCWGTCVIAATVLAQQSPASHIPEKVKLLVQSTCTSVNVKLSTGETLKTPFQKIFNAGENITIEALDAEAPACGALQVVTPFRRLFVNNQLLPKGEKSASVMLESDTTILIHYGTKEPQLVTLSSPQSCGSGYGTTQIRVTESALAGQEGTFYSAFNAKFQQGQRIILEEQSSLISCGNAPTILNFDRWIIGGRVYPDEQMTVEITLDNYTTANAQYSTKVIPYPSRVQSFQLYRDGEPAYFIKSKDKASRYTVIINNDALPVNPRVQIFYDVNTVEADIIKQDSPNQLEIRLPNIKVKKPGLLLIYIRTSDGNFWSPSVPVEVVNP